MADSEGNIVVNHVLSQDIKSAIFDDIFRYFNEHSPAGVKQVPSIRPIEGADIYHYHRPQLEAELLKPSLITIHHDLNDPDDWVTFDKFLPKFKQADKIICLNSSQQKMLAEHGIKNTVIIPHGHNDKLLKNKRPKAFAPKDKITLGIFSKRYPRKVKGEAYFYELAKRLHNKHFRFMLIGGGRTTDGNYLRKHGFDVEVYEHLPYRVMVNAYHAIDYLLITSLHEGGPACVPEALATATPMITTKIGMAADMVENGINGIFLEFDADSDAEKLELIYENKNKIAEKLHNGALLKAQNVSTWQDCVHANVEAQLSVLEKKKPKKKKGGSHANHRAS
jgi:glycosyltransferase involved in cell wall biosynthesis